MRLSASSHRLRLFDYNTIIFSGWRSLHYNVIARSIDGLVGCAVQCSWRKTEMMFIATYIRISQVDWFCSCQTPKSATTLITRHWNAGREFSSLHGVLNRGMLMFYSLGRVCGLWNISFLTFKRGKSTVLRGEREKSVWEIKVTISWKQVLSSKCWKKLTNFSTRTEISQWGKVYFISFRVRKFFIANNKMLLFYNYRGWFTEFAHLKWLLNHTSNEKLFNRKVVGWFKGR